MNLKDRIIDISFEKGLTHIGSCITSVDIIEEIYLKKGFDEKFVLSCGHAGLALYVVLENRGYGNAGDMLDKAGIHPDREVGDFIDCSTGSLGQGLPIAVGMALADRSRDVYCLISDGECAEGSIWEALTIARDQALNNLKIYLNVNGWAAYKKVDTNYLIKRIKAFEFPVKIVKTDVKKYPFLEGLAGHYYKMTKEDYEAVR